MKMLRHIGHTPTLFLLLACGQAAEPTQSAADDSTTRLVECAASDERLADDGCGVCSCDNGQWSCPEAVETCEASCEDGRVVAAPGPCGWCTCIGDAWICDGTDTCECEYEPTATRSHECAQTDCTPYGTFDEGCASGGQILDDEQAGLDPFATREIVPCEDLVPRLDDGTSNRVSQVNVDDREITLTIEYTGGCAEHQFGLCFLQRDAPRGFENNARTVELVVAHDRGGDLCGQPSTATESFDLTNAIELYEERMDRFGLERGDRMLLRIFGHGDPALRRTIPVLLEEP